jgi:hypothetical protein
VNVLGAEGGLLGAPFTRIPLLEEKAKRYVVFAGIENDKPLKKVYNPLAVTLTGVPVAINVQAGAATVGVPDKEVEVYHKLPVVLPVVNCVEACTSTLVNVTGLLLLFVTTNVTKLAPPIPAAGVVV